MGMRQMAANLMDPHCWVWSIPARPGHCSGEELCTPLLPNSSFVFLLSNPNIGAGFLPQPLGKSHFPSCSSSPNVGSGFLSQNLDKSHFPSYSSSPIPIFDQDSCHKFWLNPIFLYIPLLPTLGQDSFHKLWVNPILHLQHL